MITYSDTTTSEGIFYQPDDYIGYSHIQGLYALQDKEYWKEKTLLYFVTLFKKCSEGRFDYGNKFNRKIASEMIVNLPTKNGEIDYEFMEAVISGVQKLVIKGVVDYKDEVIKTTKNVVSQNKEI